MEKKIFRFKACWIVKGYLQEFDINFNQTYIVVIKQIVFLVLFVIASYYDLDIKQMDVKTIFLYGFINQLIYVKIFKRTNTKKIENIIYKLLKTVKMG